MVKVFKRPLFTNLAIACLETPLMRAASACEIQSFVFPIEDGTLEKLVDTVNPFSYTSLR